MLLLDTDDPAFEYAWEIVDKMAQRVTTIETKDEGMKLLMRYKKTSEIDRLNSSVFNPTFEDEKIRNMKFDEQIDIVESDGFDISSDEECDNDDDLSSDEEPESDSVVADDIDYTVVDGPTTAAPPPPPPVPVATIFDRTSRVGTNVPKPPRRLKKVNWGKLTLGSLKNQYVVLINVFLRVLQMPF